MRIILESKNGISAAITSIYLPSRRRQSIIKTKTGQKRYFDQVILIKIWSNRIKMKYNSSKIVETWVIFVESG